MGELLVAVEGLDGAGKSTQVALLASALSAVDVVSFPRYDTFFGRHIRHLLDGEGEVSAQSVDPRSMALWYALDRVQWARDRKPATDGVVLLNRYTLSNAVYQSARAGDGDVYERSAALLARVREGYLAAATRLPGVVVVSAAGSPSAVHTAVLTALAPVLSGPDARPVSP